LKEITVPKFHIALRTESIVSETLDIERENLTDLRIELARFVGELLKDHANQIWVDEDWRVDVTAEDGLILYVMHVSASQAPAAAQASPPDLKA
jgi:hypothetical protein